MSRALEIEEAYATPLSTFPSPTNDNHEDRKKGFKYCFPGAITNITLEMMLVLMTIFVLLKINAARKNKTSLTLQLVKYGDIAVMIGSFILGVMDVFLFIRKEYVHGPAMMMAHALVSSFLVTATFTLCWTAKGMLMYNHIDMHDHFCKEYPGFCPCYKLVFLMHLLGWLLTIPIFICSTMYLVVVHGKK